METLISEARVFMGDLELIEMRQQKKEDVVFDLGKLYQKCRDLQNLIWAEYQKTKGEK